MPKTVSTVGLDNISELEDKTIKKLIEEDKRLLDLQFKKCPYRTVVRTPGIVYPVIEERFDFQIAEGGKIERVSLGRFDLAKEINSHKNEVGLINVLKLAEGRGMSLDMFAKTNPGLMADFEEINTFDDLLTAKADADAKIASIAKEFGLTPEQLIEAVKTGQKLTPNKESEVKENGTNANE